MVTNFAQQCLQDVGGVGVCARGRQQCGERREVKKEEGEVA